MEKLHAVVWKEGKWFVAKTLEIEIASQGRTEKQALDNLKEAIELYFEDKQLPEVINIQQPKLQDIYVQLNA